MPEPDRSSDPISAVSNLPKSEIGVRDAASDSYAPQQIREDRPLRFFVSYAHLDQRLKEDLLERLLIRLKSRKTLRIEPGADKDIEVGEKWFDAINRAMEECDFAVLLLSLNSSRGISSATRSFPGSIRTSL